MHKNPQMRYSTDEKLSVSEERSAKTHPLSTIFDKPTISWIFYEVRFGSPAFESFHASKNNKLNCRRREVEDNKYVVELVRSTRELVKEETSRLSESRLKGSLISGGSVTISRAIHVKKRMNWTK